MPTLHIVRTGECIDVIAAQAGLAPDAIWQHGRNAALRELRRDPGVLMAGDVVYVPDVDPPPLRVRPSGQHRFRCRVPTAELRVVLEGSGGLPFRVEADSASVTGATEADGTLRCELPVATTEATLILEPDSERERRVLLHVGGLDPADTVSGAKQRLFHLGYRILDFGDRATGDFPPAVRAFQAQEGLEATGELDAATAAALRERHGR